MLQERLRSLPAEASYEDRPAIAVAGVRKSFLLPHQRHTTLKARLLHPFASPLHERMEALHDVSFEVDRGEFFAVVGRNGSGKSTLLRCLAGIYPAGAGTIDIDGRLAPFIDLGVGFNAELSARENVVQNAIVCGLTRKQATERWREMLAFAELEEFADQKLKNFSTGMGVRLGFAVTVHVDADVFLFDEVLAVGDAAFQQKCFAHFESLREQRKTIVLVTHDMKLLRSCDRALLLDRGRVIDTGDPVAIAEQYAELNAQGVTRKIRPVAETVREDTAARRVSLLGAAPRRFPGFVRLLAVTDFKLKYMDSRLSYLWAVARPLARFGVMLLIFTQLGRFSDGVPNYPVYLLMSIVLWIFFSQATESSVRSLVQRADLLRKLPFPQFAVPLAQVVTSLIDLAANLVVVVVIAIAFGLVPSARWLELIPALAVLTLFATGFALLLSAAFVRHRDVDQVWSVVVQTAFYCTPIFYVTSSVPESFTRLLVLANPIATVLTEARHAVVDPAAPSAAAVAGGYPFLLVPLAVVLGVVSLGLWLFRRESPWAAENL